MKVFLATFPNGEEKKIEAFIKDGKHFIKLEKEEIEVNDSSSLFFDSKIYISTRDFQGAIDLKEISYDSAEESSSNTDLKAKFPGKVIKIFAKEGGSYKKGDVLLTMEAMKMEFVYSAPKDLKIKKILVKENQTIDKGSEFFEWE